MSTCILILPPKSSSIGCLSCTQRDSIQALYGEAPHPFCPGLLANRCSLSESPAPEHIDLTRRQNDLSKRNHLRRVHLRSDSASGRDATSKWRSPDVVADVQYAHLRSNRSHADRSADHHQAD